MASSSPVPPIANEPARGGEHTRAQTALANLRSSSATYAEAVMSSAPDVKRSTSTNDNGRGHPANAASALAAAGPEPASISSVQQHTLADKAEQPKTCPTWVGGTEIFPVPPFSRQVGRIFLRGFPANFYEFKMDIYIAQRQACTSQFCTAARQCLDTQGHIEHLPLPQRFQQLPTIHRHHVDVSDFCSNGEPSSARPIAILSM